MLQTPLGQGPGQIAGGQKMGFSGGVGLAQKGQGTFVLRIEDTDVERSTQESVDAILQAMDWLGLSYDEGLTWTEGKTIYPGSAAYSSLTVLENGDIGLFFEKDYYTENLFVSFSLEWLTDGEDSYEKPLAK